MGVRGLGGSRINRLVHRGVERGVGVHVDRRGGATTEEGGRRFAFPPYSCWCHKIWENKKVDIGTWRGPVNSRGVGHNRGTHLNGIFDSIKAAAKPENDKRQ